MGDLRSNCDVDDDPGSRRDIAGRQGDNHTEKMAYLTLYMKKISDIAAVALILFIAWQVAERIQETNKMNSPWLEVVNVHVDDHITGTEKRVLDYSRIIHQEFTADWFVKVFSHETGANECYGKGTNRYQPKDEVNRVTLEWYIGRDCKLSPGEYTLNTIWVNVDGRSIQNFSNRFKVSSE